MIIKDGTVELGGLSKEGWQIVLACETAMWQLIGDECVVTRGTEYAEGSVGKSAHTRGDAVDVSIALLERHQRDEFRMMVKEKLDPGDLDTHDLVLYDTHAHIEYDPATRP